MPHFRIQLKHFQPDVADLAHLEKWAEAPHREAIAQFLDGAGLAGQYQAIEPLEVPGLDDLSDGMELIIGTDGKVHSDWDPEAWLLDIQDAAPEPSLKED